MADNDHIGIAAKDADGIFDLLDFNLGGKHARLLGGKNAAAEPLHGGFEGKAGARRRRIKQRGHDAVLIIERAAASDYPLHAARALEQLHQQRDGELLRFDDVPQPSAGAGIDRSGFRLADKMS